MFIFFFYYYYYYYYKPPLQIYSYVLQFICRTVVAILTSTLANQKIFMLLLMVLSNNFEKKGRKDYKSLMEGLIVAIKEF